MALTTLRRDGDIAFLGLNRPDKHNALDQAMVDELGAALLNLRRSPCIVVLCSETPGIFAAGADIAELLERDSDAGLRGIYAMLFEQLEAHPWPTIAAIDGPVLGGGCELAMACDFRLVSPRALYDMTAQALLFDSSDKRERMSRFLQERAARRSARKEAER